MLHAFLVRKLVGIVRLAKIEQGKKWLIGLHAFKQDFHLSAGMYSGHVEFFESFGEVGMPEPLHSPEAEREVAALAKARNDIDCAAVERNDAGYSCGSVGDTDELALVPVVKW